jgi:bacterial regulatory proteins, luxR family
VFAPLTEREYEVVEAVAEGLDNAGVAYYRSARAG